jgi:hypothetical protein
MSMQQNPWFPKGSITTYSWKPVKVFVFHFTLCQYWELGSSSSSSSRAFPVANAPDVPQPCGLLYCP